MSIKKFRIRIIVMIMIGASMIIGIALIAGVNTTKGKVEETVERDLKVVVNMADLLITSELNLLREKDISLAACIVGSSDSDEMLQILDEKINEIEYKDFIGLTVFGENGILTSTGTYPMMPELLDNSYISMAFEGNTVFSPIIPVPGKDKTIIYICTPVRKNLILIATVDGLFFHNFLKQFRIWDTGHIVVIDHEGYMISNLRESWITERFNPVIASETKPEYRDVAVVMKKMIDGESGIGRYVIDGAERIVSYRPVTGSLVGWSIAAVASLPESPMSGVKEGFVLVAFICFLLCIMAAFVTSAPITNQVKRIEELKIEADYASKSKSEFLANMSHELRTPLNAIIGLSELTLSGNNAEEEKEENIKKVYTAGVTMLGLINNILDISKVESGKFEIIPVSYDTPSIINDTIALNIVRIGSKPIEFKVNVDENLPARLIGDDMRIRQVFNNFLSNAFKYTHAGTVEWSITFEQSGDDVLLISKVKDSGIGIKPEDLQHLFTKFNRVDSKANRGTEGTGLGLALTKRIVDMMGGTLDLESEYGVGSTFTAMIPQKKETDAVIGKTTAEKLRDNNYFEQKRDRSSKLVRKQLPYARVLVVDDVLTNLDVAHGMMKPYGMQVDLVTSGKKAVNLIREGSVKYDAIFMDHMMPEMDGIEATRIIREEIGTEYAENITIIALTANAILGNEELFLNNGFQAFLSKPIDIMLLDTTINTWVRDKDKERWLESQPKSDVSAEAGEAQEHAPEADGADNAFDILIEKLEQIPGFRADTIAEKFDDIPESITSVLQSYIQNTPPLLAKLRQVKEAGLPDYAVTVHGIKGSSRSIAAEDVGTAAEALELSAKKGDFTFVSAHNDEFIDKTEQLIGALQSALVGISETKKKTAAPDKTLLCKLREAADVFDIDAAEEFLVQLEAFDYEEQGDLVEWLRAQFDVGGFKKISEKLRQ